ncbi:hypothetical protein T265_06553 [Opisthorchis viverrini]|uniref:Uncharacterized protein n=1 Tax=Opisthorchis viverrini TaxID=6198 RepID=A0A074ZK43_OPIVI|nr:hypothetical protein T265_06553 [Opisthorchis viverrini]KER26137.1 hypothetical protein T265_06553 [Opisthorchis viverrini]
MLPKCEQMRLPEFRNRPHFSRGAERVYEKTYYSHASPSVVSPLHYYTTLPFGTPPDDIMEEYYRQSWWKLSGSPRKVSPFLGVIRYVPHKRDVRLGLRIRGIRPRDIVITPGWQLVAWSEKWLAAGMDAYLPYVRSYRPPVSAQHGQNSRQASVSIEKKTLHVVDQHPSAERRRDVFAESIG